MREKKTIIAAVAVISFAVPVATAASATAPKIGRFSQALRCAAIARSAQASWGLSAGEGLPMAGNRPRTMIRFRI